MSGHTKGPWHLEGPSFGFGSIVSDEGDLIFGIASGGPDECQSEDVCEANANLISAAPELLEALEELLGATEEIGYVHYGPYRAAARAAIAKARGAA